MNTNGARSFSASAADSFLKPSRQFRDSIWLAAPNRLPGDQVSANSKGHRTRQKEAERSPLIHASSRDQRNIWEHGLQRTNVAVVADVRARNNFDKIRTELPRRDHVRRS